MGAPSRINLHGRSHTQRNQASLVNIPLAKALVAPQEPHKMLPLLIVKDEASVDHS